MLEFSKSCSPSKVWLPKDENFKTSLEFMVQRFPYIDEKVWRERFSTGKVYIEGGELLKVETPYLGGNHLYYFREVPKEFIVPFEEKIIFRNENFLIVDKPHFLPIHPSGQYVNETLVNRLRQKLGNKEIVAAHRLDRLTAGLVLCVLAEENRGIYQKMFDEHKIHKTYHAIGLLPKNGKEWHIQNRLVAYQENFRMVSSEGEVNAESFIKLLKTDGVRGLFELRPLSGKKHQLRVHMTDIGSGIENDPLYPEIQDNRVDDYEKPLKLLAKKLSFIDPIEQKNYEFFSEFDLQL